MTPPSAVIGDHEMVAATVVEPAAVEPVAARPAWTARAVLRVIRIYQALRGGRPSPCRFLPTCSLYATEAVARHGAARGGFLALRRVLRCHPWGGHGLDPVPQ